MTTHEILKQLPGLSRDTIYYWERRGWIASSPATARSGEASRREYSDEEFRKIQKIWKYYQEGLRPEKAYERALKDLKEVKSGRSSKAGL
jgi:DNA-binding transcriptional MerR regulator